jgi:hypothetical protein
VGGWPSLLRRSFPKTKRGCPILAFFARVGRDTADTLKPHHAARTASLLRCSSTALYHLFLLSANAVASIRAESRLCSFVLEQTRKRYRFVVVGYVIMPEHIHLITERTGGGHSVDRDAGIEATDGAGIAAESETPRSTTE